MTLAALMLIAALAFVLVPLLRGHVAADPKNETRRTLKALEQARADGILTDEEYASKRAKLGAELIAASGTPARTRTGFIAALVVALVLPSMAILLYRQVGSPQALDPSNLIANTSDEGHATNLEAAIVQLAEKMKQDPDNAEGWALLGRAYKSTQRFTEARDALKHAHDLVPEDADLMVDYAESIVFSSSDRRIQGEALTLIDRAIEKNPQNQKGLWLAGIADSQAGKYDDAVKKWNALLQLLEPGSDVATSIRDQIAQAEALRDGKPLPAKTSAPSASNASTSSTAESASSNSNQTSDTTGAHIAVEVALDPKLKDKVSPGDTLFVFAKAASGPPMPLAIAKLTAAQLPASVTLTDAMSMVPNMKISAFAQIVVGARISKSGQAIAQSGDLQTLSTPLPNTRSDPVMLTIDQVVP